MQKIRWAICYGLAICGCCLPDTSSVSVPVESNSASIPVESARVPVESKSATKSFDHPMPGGVGILTRRDYAAIAVGVSEAAYDRYTTLEIAGDDVGGRQLLEAGLIWAEESGTQVLMIDFGILVSEVRIMSGPNTGRSGFVATDWVRTNPTIAVSPPTTEPATTRPAGRSPRDAPITSSDVANAKAILGDCMRLKLMIEEAKKKGWFSKNLDSAKAEGEFARSWWGHGQRA